MPGTHEIVRALRDRHPTVPVVAFAVAGTPDAVVEWAEAGAAAFVGREATVDEMFETIVAATRGELLCSPRAAAALLARVSALSDRRDRAARLDSLTVREQEVARLLVEGLSNKQIAARLTIELATVKNHVHSILDKLGVAGRRDAASVARAELSRAP
jgi:DNA-binding NarL/FixJ family response regulator